MSDYANKSTYSVASLAQAFHSNLSLNETTRDWYVDSGATTHMAPSSAHVDSSKPYHDKDRVIFGNGNVLPVSQIGTTSISPRLELNDIFIVPHIKNNLLSVSKLTNNFLVDFFSCAYFAI